MEKWSPSQTASIQDRQTRVNIVTVVAWYEYQDLFPTNFSEMRGIVGDLGEIKIPLRPDAKPSKQQQKAGHGQYIRVKPSEEGRLVLRYGSNLFKHPGKLKTH